jgi:hypothetical protein
MTKVTEEQLQNFCAVTGSTVDRARFYLEAANGDLDVTKKISANQISLYSQHFINLIDGC